MTILELKELSAGSLLPDDCIVFGGTFDPIHEGHVSVIRRLLRLFRTVVIAPTASNPWKQEKPTELDLRRKMIGLVLAAEKLPAASEVTAPGVFISAEPYVYSEELAAHLRALRPGRIFWAVGSDSADTVKDWRNWEAAGVPTVSVPVEVEAHAVHVRSGKASPHPAIRDFVAKEGLYGGTR